MNEDEGTYSQLAEIAQTKAPDRDASPTPPPPPLQAERRAPAEGAAEDVNTTPHLSQNYRFTEDELRWLRKQAYNLTERLGAKVSQNTVLRIALHTLRDACAKQPKRNPLLEAASRLKK